jgi:hypothetical protein
MTITKDVIYGATICIFNIKVQKISFKKKICEKMKMINTALSQNIS